MKYQYIFKVTFLQQMRSLNSMFIIVIATYIGLYFIIGKELKGILLFYCSIAPLIICILPTLFVHIQYLIVNWGSCLKVDAINRKAIYTKGDLIKTFSFEDINHIDRYTYPNINNGWYSFAGYRYMAIILKDKTKIIITSLMIYKIERLEIIFERQKAEVNIMLLAVVH